VLVCDELTVERGRARRWTPPAVASPTQLCVVGSKEVSWVDLLRLLHAPPGAAVFEHVAGRRARQPLRPEELGRTVSAPYLGMYRVEPSEVVSEDTEPWLWVQWALAISRTGHHITLMRGSCSDEAWTCARALPASLAPCQVTSGTMQVSDAEWMGRLELTARCER
jgi:hypothetical protein